MSHESWWCGPGPGDDDYYDYEEPADDPYNPWTTIPIYPTDRGGRGRGRRGTTNYHRIAVGSGHRPVRSIGISTVDATPATAPNPDPPSARPLQSMTVPPPRLSIAAASPSQPLSQASVIASAPSRANGVRVVVPTPTQPATTPTTTMPSATSTFPASIPTPKPKRSLNVHALFSQSGTGAPAPSPAVVPRPPSPPLPLPLAPLLPLPSRPPPPWVPAPASAPFWSVLGSAGRDAVSQPSSAAAFVPSVRSHASIQTSAPNGSAAALEGTGPSSPKVSIGTSQSRRVSLSNRRSIRLQSTEENLQLAREKEEKEKKQERKKEEKERLEREAKEKEGKGRKEEPHTIADEIPNAAVDRAVDTTTDVAAGAIVDAMAGLEISGNIWAARPPFERQPRTGLIRPQSPTLPARSEQNNLTQRNRQNEKDHEEDEAEFPVATISRGDAEQTTEGCIRTCLNTRSIGQAINVLQRLPEDYRSAFIEKGVTAAFDGGIESIAVIERLFRAAYSQRICAPKQFESGFLPAVEAADDTSMDLPRTYEWLARLMHAAGLSKARVERLAERIVVVGEPRLQPKYLLVYEFEKLFA